MKIAFQDFIPLRPWHLEKFETRIQELAKVTSCGMPTEYIEITFRLRLQEINAVRFHFDQIHSGTGSPELYRPFWILYLLLYNIIII